MLDTDTIEALAERLRDAEEWRRPIAPLRDEIPAGDIPGGPAPD